MLLFPMVSLSTPSQACPYTASSVLSTRISRSVTELEGSVEKGEVRPTASKQSKVKKAKRIGQLPGDRHPTARCRTTSHLARQQRLYPLHEHLDHRLRVNEAVEVMELLRDCRPGRVVGWEPPPSISSNASCTAERRVMASSTMFSLCRIQSISLACCLACMPSLAHEVPIAVCCCAS